VIAHGEKIVGQGWHKKAGEAHAEIHALQQAGEKAKGATAYVTLEPCAHQGRTGPCAQALINAGIKKVVAAISDPNPQVAGNGFAQLRAAGIECEVGLMADQAREVMRGFLSRMEHQRPFVTLKMASSIDSRVALPNGESQWITDELARRDVQLLRARHQAVITGVGTVLKDNPRLNLRRDQLDLPSHLHFDELTAPLRVVLDSHGQVTAAHHVCDGSAPTVLVRSQPMPDIEGVESLLIPNDEGRIDLDVLLFTLAQRGINDALLECGPTLAAAFLAVGLVDELVLYQAPCWLGADAIPLLSLLAPDHMNQVQRWHTRHLTQLGRDWRVILRPQQ
jgi:diaminohydroxyphosphoribosylaminopyrimidine deaminase/5-amino-6-(5-phosphoribosylamino)uracil reductase